MRVSYNEERTQNEVKHPETQLRKKNTVTAGLDLYELGQRHKNLSLPCHQFPFVIGSFQRNCLATSKESSKNISKHGYTHTYKRRECRRHSTGLCLLFPVICLLVIHSFPNICRSALPEKLTVPQSVNIFPAFYRARWYINCSREPATGPYPRTVLSTYPTYFLVFNFNIILSSIVTSSKLSLSFRFSYPHHIFISVLFHTCRIANKRVLSVVTKRTTLFMTL